MSVNSLLTRFRDDEKVPVPIDDESYFYQHSPVKFSVEIKNKNTAGRHSASGMVFMTDKRIMFIAEEPASDGFENFQVFLGDIVSSVISVNRYFRRNVFSVTVTLRNGTTINMAITYDPEDIEDKRILEDYYGMLITWTTKIDPERYRNAGSRISGESYEE